MLNHASDKGVYVLAATNHPECIDKAVLRTGRIDELVYVDMPDHEARKSLFALELAKLPREEDIDMDRLAHLTQGFNCSDINYIVKSAARKKFNEAIGCGEHTLQCNDYERKNLRGFCPSWFLLGEERRRRL